MTKMLCTIALAGAPLWAAACSSTVSSDRSALAAAAERCAPGGAGNPFVDGWYADPDMRVYDHTYWVYPTYSAPYDQQTFLDAFSSPDLLHWTRHPRILDTTTVTWATRAIWAPSPISRDGKYFLYFGANDIQDNTQLGGIGVAVADTPAGPFRDALGRPLIGQYANGAQPIDQNVFLDDDGQAYLYYGGHGHCNVVKLGRDMTSLATFPDGTTFREITPSGYVEGALMFKRDGIYYLMWSEGGWTGPDYRVSYAMARSPTGPFDERGTILSQNGAIATGSGHNTVVNVPGTDDWYIFYHRHPLGATDGNDRVLSYDRMTFAADGTIAPVAMTTSDDFCDGNALGWTPHGGSWSVAGGRYVTGAAAEAKSVLNTQYFVLAYDADVTVDGPGDAGVMFRAASVGDTAGAYRGYYAVIDAAHSRVVLGTSNGTAQTVLATSSAAIAAGTTHHLRVIGNGTHLAVYLDGAAAPVIAIDDATYAGGTTGVIAHATAAAFDNLHIADPPGVVFYQDGGYSGSAIALDPGAYTLRQLRAAGIANDAVSSIRIPPGFTVQLYADEGFAGTLWTFTADTPLMPAAANDVMSSVRITGPTP